MNNATADDIVAACEPKSDRFNADDLAGAGRTLDVTIVATAAYQDKGERKIACRLDGWVRTYHPCKTMRRLLLAAWGPDWIGRTLRLYTDPTVKWAGVPAGGLRISHVSGIDEPLTVMLTETRGVKRPWTVQPLTAPVPSAPRDLAGVLADVGLTVDDVDRWRLGLTPPRCPVADLDAGGREQLAEWLAGDPGRADVVRGVTT